MSRRAPSGAAGVRFHPPPPLLLSAYAKDFSAAHTSSAVRDVVITHKQYATQGEKLALIDAAELAGLNVLGLVEENTAAAVHYGIDRVTEENSTHTLLLYNMGATSTQVSVVVYTSYQDKSAGKPKPVGQGLVIGKAYDISLGGRSFDSALVDYVADAFNADVKVAAKLPSSAHGDIRAVAPAM